MEFNYSLTTNKKNINDHHLSYNETNLESIAIKYHATMNFNNQIQSLTIRWFLIIQH